MKFKALICLVCLFYRLSLGKSLRKRIYAKLSFALQVQYRYVFKVEISLLVMNTCVLCKTGDSFKQRKLLPSSAVSVRLFPSDLWRLKSCNVHRGCRPFCFIIDRTFNSTLRLYLVCLQLVKVRDIYKACVW